jgi:lipopolysaccharide/colanic/teichoic acid biosynthesis glycosyltransferase
MKIISISKQHNRFFLAQLQLKKLQLESELTIKRSKAYHFTTILYPFLKRSIDILISTTALITLSPLFLLCVILIKIQDRGPVLYLSNRVGVRGELFKFPKFRSMAMNAENHKSQLKKINKHGKDGITFKMKEDPRVTKIGKWMRRFSIDELPQLYCVLIGTMTLVGPRPPIPSEVTQYTLKDRHRLDVKPGITCIWQVSGRGDIPFPIQMKMDLEYVRKRNLKLDLKILLKTIPAVLTGKGAY